MGEWSIGLLILKLDIGWGERLFHVPAASPPGNDSPVLIGWATEPVWAL